MATGGGQAVLARGQEGGREPSHLLKLSLQTHNIHSSETIIWEETGFSFTPSVFLETNILKYMHALLLDPKAVSPILKTYLKIPKTYDKLQDIVPLLVPRQFL